MTTMLQSEILAVYAIFGSEEEAKRIARDMVERRLAACANVLGPCHSIYRWQDKVEEAPEVAAIFKSTFERAEELMRAIHAAHSYEVPAIVALPISLSHREYFDWVIESSR
ncbi:MAG: divalent-cation tolerance protein CutA [Sphingosinicella sp.]